MIGPAAEANQGQAVGGPASTLGGGLAEDAQGHLDVFLGRQGGDEGEGLEDEADVVLANLGALVGGQPVDVLAEEGDAAGGWRVEAADQVEECRFAGAGTAAKECEAAARDGQIDAAQGIDGLVANGVDALEIAYLYQWSSVEFGNHQVTGFGRGVAGLGGRVRRREGGACGGVTVPLKRPARAVRGRIEAVFRRGGYAFGPGIVSLVCVRSFSTSRGAPSRSLRHHGRVRRGVGSCAQAARSSSRRGRRPRCWHRRLRRAAPVPGG